MQQNEDLIQKQFISRTDVYFPMNKTQDDFCCLPYGILLQPFNKKNIKTAQNPKQKLIRCPQCNAAASCYSEITGIKQCPFCLQKIDLQTTCLPFDEMQEFKLPTKQVITPFILFIIDISSSKGFKFIEQLLEFKLFDRMLDVIPDVRVSISFFSQQFHLLHVYHEDKYEICSFVDVPDCKTIPHTILILKQICYTLKAILSNTIFIQQLRSLVVINNRNIINAIITGIKLLQHCKLSDKTENINNQLGHQIYLTAFGPDINIDNERNKKDFDKPNNSYIQESLLSLLPQESIKNQFSQLDMKNIELNLFFQTNNFIDAANYTWICNKIGKLNIYNEQSTKFLTDFTGDLLSYNNKIFNLQITIQLSENSYQVKRVVGKGQQISDKMFVSQCCNDSSFFVITLETNTSNKLKQLDNTHYIQFQMNFTNSQGWIKQRIITTQLMSAKQNVDLICNYNILPKLVMLQSLCALNAEPVILSQNQKNIELGYGYIAFQQQLRSQIPLFIQNAQPLLENEDSKTLALTQLLRGIFNILHTNIFQKNLNNIDDRLLCIHNSFCCSMQYVINIIIPQIYICPIFNSQIQKFILDIKHTNNTLQLQRYYSMYYRGYANLSILQENSQFGANNGFQTPSVAVVLNKNQSQILIIINDNFETIDDNIELCMTDLDFSEKPQSSLKQFGLLSKFSVSIGRIDFNSRKSSIRDSTDKSNKETSLRFGVSKYSSRLSVFVENQRSYDLQSSAENSDNGIVLNYQNVQKQSGLQVKHAEQISNTSNDITIDSEITYSNQMEQRRIKTIIQQINVKAAVSALKQINCIQNNQISVLLVNKNKDLVDELMFESGVDGIDDWINRLFSNKAQ